MLSNESMNDNPSLSKLNICCEKKSTYFNKTYTTKENCFKSLTRKA